MERARDNCAELDTAGLRSYRHGGLELADVDSASLLENDNRVAEEFDARRFVQQQLGNAGQGNPG